MYSFCYVYITLYSHVHNLEPKNKKIISINQESQKIKQPQVQILIGGIIMY
jgi:hypothetical protein